MVDLEGFDESHFGIFPDTERPALAREWRKATNVNKFLTILSPVQREQVTDWMISRTKYDRKQLASALKDFSKYLKRKTKHDKYPFKNV